MQWECSCSCVRVHLGLDHHVQVLSNQSDRTMCYASLEPVTRDCPLKLNQRLDDMGDGQATSGNKSMLNKARKTRVSPGDPIFP